MITALVQEPVDRLALEVEVAAALASPDTKIFLDTSTLVWIYRLHEAARAEFVDWLENGPHPGRAQIPSRALHELSKHRHNQSVLFPFRQKLNQLPALLRQLDEWAHLITDDDRAKDYGYKDRAEYFELLSETQANLERVIKPVASGADPRAVEAQLIPLFNRLAMDGDIHSDLDIIKAEYAARAELRFPPGYEDRKKKPDNWASGTPSSDTDDSEILHGANRFGDYAIWCEILDWVDDLAEKPGAVVLITHDQKRDWLYIPQQIVDLDGREKNNLRGTDRVTVAHPLLCKELAHRTGVDRLHILTVPQLAQIASRQDIDATLVELARAAQAEALEYSNDGRQSDDSDKVASVEGEDEVSGAQEETAEAGVEIGDTVEAVVVEAEPTPVDVEDVGVEGALENLPPEALEDRLYRRDVGGDRGADTVIKDLKSYNWYTQNPAAKSALGVLRAGDPSNLQTFILGRNIYQAACGGAGTPINIIESLEQELRSVAEDRANIFYAGALFEAYFDSNGALRPTPKFERIEGLFELQDERRYSPAVDWLRSKIGDHKDKYLALPQTKPEIVNVELTVAPDSDKVTSIKAGGVELAEEAGPGTYQSLGADVDQEKILRKLSKHYDVPDWMIAIRPVIEGTLDFSDLSLKEWGPSTDFSFSPNDTT